MAKALAKEMVALDGLPGYLKRYQAQYFNDSSTDKGHVYWSAPVQRWMLVMRKGNQAQVTFHAPEDCPCKMI